MDPRLVILAGGLPIKVNGVICAIPIYHLPAISSHADCEYEHSRCVLRIENERRLQE